MPNPSDAYSYAQGVKDMAPHEAAGPTNFGRGIIDGRRRERMRPL
jgi:hypothetical protein